MQIAARKKFNLFDQVYLGSFESQYLRRPVTDDMSETRVISTCLSRRSEAGVVQFATFRGPAGGESCSCHSPMPDEGQNSYSKR